MTPAISKTPGYTRELVDFVHGLRPGSLPDEVLDRARYFLLDYLAVTIRGSREQSAQCVQRTVERLIPGGATSGSATVIGTPIRTLPVYAAFANGAAAHGIEHDDTHSGGSIHLGATMYSAALALAEAVQGTARPDFF